MKTSSKNRVKEKLKATPMTDKTKPNNWHMIDSLTFKLGWGIHYGDRQELGCQ